MTTERLEWLELSPPPSPTPPKTPLTDRSPCPFCGWPVEPETMTCAHCGQSLTDSLQTADLLAGLDIQLPPPVVNVEPAPEGWFDGSALDSPALYDLRLQAEQMRVTTGFDRLICLDDISVEQYQHQLEAALRVLRDMRGQALLADEVGLGKTIEAGIVMKELIERGLAYTILILTPASLTWQWHEEMATKFHEEFTVLERLKQLPSSKGIAQLPRSRWIVSLDRAKMPRWSERFLAREYDLLIIDEAHKLKNHRTQAYRFVNQIRKRYVLMLTATPVHNDLMELYNLITILRPGHLGTRTAFRDNFMFSATRSKRRVLTWRVKNANGVSTYVKSARNVRNRHYRLYRCNTAHLDGSDFAVEDLPDLPPISDMRFTVAEEDLTAFLAIRRELVELLQQGYAVDDAWLVTFKGRRWSSQDQDFDGKLCGLRLELTRTAVEDNPNQAGAGDSEYKLTRKPPTRVKRQTTPRNPAALRELLREVMIRNRRTRVGVRFPPRKAAVYSLNLTPPERRLYDNVTAYIREQLRQARSVSGGKRGATRLAMMTLQKQLSSSPQAVARTLRKMVDRQADDPVLAEQLVLAWGIERGRKVEAVLAILAEYPGKFLIFTEYLPSMQALHDTLQAADQAVVVFHGGMSALERAEAVRTFRGPARVMVSTRSGGEGHNLQFCHQMVNYDLPWNPMRIEQRVGRLHRLGQKEAVTIFNLAANNTIEAYILDLLAHKIRMFELVIGEMDLILGDLGDNRSFEKHIEQAWANSYSEEALLAMIAELERVLDHSQTSYEQIRGVSDELSDILDAYDEPSTP